MTAPHYPAGESRVKVPAAWLIEQAGFPRGYVQGRVGISPFQSQAIINRGGASAEDVLALALCRQARRVEQVSHRAGSRTGFRGIRRKSGTALAT